MRSSSPRRLATYRRFTGSTSATSAYRVRSPQRLRRSSPNAPQTTSTRRSHNVRRTVGQAQRLFGRNELVAGGLAAFAVGGDVEAVAAGAGVAVPLGAVAGQIDQGVVA